MTTYIVVARNVANPAVGDRAMYGVVAWTIEARSPAHAVDIVREQQPDARREGLAVILARHFHEFGPVE